MPSPLASCYTTAQPSPLREELTSSPVPESHSWTCCQCHTTTPLSINSGQHPLGAVSCICPHKPCECCTFTGLTHFLPIIEPGVVPLSLASPSSSSGSEIPFGIICSDCGLSWRVEETAAQARMFRLRKMPSVRGALRGFHNHKLLGQAGRLRKSRSLVALGLQARDATGDEKDEVEEKEQEKKEEKPASFTTVTFSGLTCSCGRVSSLDSSFCFRVVTPKRISSVPEAAPAVVKTSTPAPVRETVGRKTDEELMAKGHDDAMIRVCGREHPHPLRSAPVMAEDLL
ncbi:hypothetical protein K505DRAFT_362725 [Melanomma pulvis-pyrius CBS 109.77]|uniref:Probable double zinc ribbon domain-containing protein n=1 Tax=Melanomma pulvis-pyrius CBS 109.77 TaxID=1314802 RepID=A0A6A6X9M2_9PLEO|nr:hypothetical protein K505DRAFT_362725 [Melanomma pulvis-pyrius CBS 109.77]